MALFEVFLATRKNQVSFWISRILTSKLRLFSSDKYGAIGIHQYPQIANEAPSYNASCSAFRLATRLALCGSGALLSLNYGNNKQMGLSVSSD
ncbi:hypothetical protein QSH57_009256 [Fusarium oxysporum f. sp. vasinfectum]|nr:hypothetical protein QSH57_009256 [Fusarium oxysporum f. sp. vasinfectum]